MKTPNVYMQEEKTYPESVVGVETAIPAFIGITDKAQNGNDNLTGIPWKISSMTEYLQYFGGAPELKFNVDIKKFFYLSEKQKAEKVTPKKTLSNTLTEPVAGIFKYCVRPEGETGKIKFNEITQIGEESEADGEDTPVGYAFCVDGDNKYTLYYNMLLFFANGGNSCYVVSVGSYGGDSKDTMDASKVDTALKALEKVREVTLIIVPEAVENIVCCTHIHQLMLKHCGEMANRFAILDIPPKYPSSKSLKTRMEAFQESISSNYLSFGAAYFPWLNTNVLNYENLVWEMFTWSDNACALMEKFADPAVVEIVKSFCCKPEKKQENREALQPKMNNTSTLYHQAMNAVLNYLNCLPSSAAMAGIYTTVDNNRGVWKAPANINLNYVGGTTEDIDDGQQAVINAAMNGKAINVIRCFQGEGIKVWGARTLDGNSQNWRYINVRRTLLFLEESVKNASRSYMFEPNDANTWINLKCMIENLLRSVWKRGGLAGATPEDAYEVHIGLGETMTAEDILKGIMRITVLVAVTHPSEFTEIAFQQQMQKSNLR